jgi:predicted PurR-regulated permease PerM
MPPAWRIVVLVAALVCGVVVVTNVFTASHQVIGWAVSASIIALLVTPVVARLDRHLPRLLAIVVTFVLVAACGIGVTWLYSNSVLDQVEQIQEDGPAVAADIEARDDRLGEIAREIHLVDQVDELVARLDERAGSGADVVRSAALSLPPYFVSMILTIFLLIYGPRMVHGAFAQMSPVRRRRLEPALGEAARRTQVYVWASILQSVVVAVVVAVVATTLDVPAVGLLAMFAGIAALLPYMGVALGWLPVLLLGLGTASEAAVIGAALAAVVMQFAEWRWWRPYVDSRSLHVGPAIPVVIAILGFAVYGVGGALYGCILAVLGLAIADQLSPGDEYLPTPVDDHPPAPAADHPPAPVDDHAVVDGG